MNLINGDSNLYLKCELALANRYFSSHSEVLTVAVVVSLWNVFWFSFIGLCEEGCYGCDRRGSIRSRISGRRGTGFHMNLVYSHTNLYLKCELVIIVTFLFILVSLFNYKLFCSLN